MKQPEQKIGQGGAYDAIKNNVGKLMVASFVTAGAGAYYAMRHKRRRSYGEKSKWTAVVLKP